MWMISVKLCVCVHVCVWFPRPCCQLLVYTDPRIRRPAVSRWVGFSGHHWPLPGQERTPAKQEARTQSLSQRPDESWAVWSGPQSTHIYSDLRCGTGRSMQWSYGRQGLNALMTAPPRQTFFCAPLPIPPSSVYAGSTSFRAHQTQKN